MEIHDSVHEAQECRRENDQEHTRDKLKIEGMRESGRKGTKQGDRAHRLDAQGQIVLWAVEVKGTDDDLEGTTTMVACIAH